MRGGQEPVYSTLARVPVTVPPGESSALFTYVAENVAFPLEPNDRLSRYLIYVGFDEGAAPRR